MPPPRANPGLLEAHASRPAPDSKAPRHGRGPDGRRAAAGRAGLRAIVTGIAAAAFACGEEVVVRVATRVYPEGGIGRRVEIRGRNADGTAPDAVGWLVDKARVELAERGAWSRFEEAPGRVAAEGFFARAEELPPTLAHRTGSRRVRDRVLARLSAEHLVVLRRWVYRETHGDPYGPPETAAALDALVTLLKRAVREELRREFGEKLDPRPAERFLEGDGRRLLADLLPALREGKTLRAVLSEDRRIWSAVLARHGVPVAEKAEELVSGEQIDLLSTWYRDRVARALSTRDDPLRGEDLAFWPVGDDADERLGAIADRVFGGEEALAEAIEPLLSILSGYYGDAGGTRFRFEATLVMPGRLLRTNGAPERDGAVWIFRDEDLARGEIAIEAESVELDAESLRSLGARRDFEALELMQLTDLLAARDPDRALRDALSRAVKAGRISLLRDEKELPEQARALARELADLLDPATASAGGR